jgi:hypothetical protein
MYRNVTMISEITNATGDIIDETIFNGWREHKKNHSKWQRVYQQKPDKTSWLLWKKALQHISYKSNRAQHLIQPLGHWIIPRKAIQQDWPHWQNPQNKRLYHKIDGEIREHHKLWYDYNSVEYRVVNDIPQTAVPVDQNDVEDSGITWHVRPYYNTWAIEETTTSNQEIHHNIQQIDEWEKQLLQRMKFLVAKETISQQQQMIIASNGSVQDHRASYGWLITTVGGTRVVKCNGPAYGYKTTSFRAEGYELLSAIRFIHHSWNKWGWNNQYIILCDNKAMLEIMQEKFRVEDTYPNHTLSAEWDIISEVRTTIDNNEMWESIQFQHIKGHADRDHPYHKLTLMQQMNVDADKLADEYIQTPR